MKQDGCYVVQIVKQMPYVLIFAAYLAFSFALCVAHHYFHVFAEPNNHVIIPEMCACSP